MGERGPGRSPDGSHVPGASPAIGRERVLGALLDRLKDLGQGQGGVCLLTGEAGIGKTRLLEEASRRAALLGYHVMAGRAQDYDHAVAYSALKDVLASLPRSAMATGPADEFDALVQATDSAVLGTPDAPDAGQPQSPYVLTTRLLHGLATSRPCVVVLDDAHLADDESLTALSLAARHLATQPLLLLFAARSDKWLPGTGFAATVGRLVEGRADAVVELDPLDESDITAFVASTLGGPTDEAVVEYVYEQSRGNPLFAREAVRSLQERGAIREEHGKRYLAGEPAPGIVTRRGALLHRVFQQDSDKRELARALSALGRVRLSDLSLLSRLTSLPIEQVQEAFDGLTDAAIVRRAESGWYEFTHPLVAEVLYDDLGPAERRRLHRMISEYVDAPPPGQTGLLEWARHVVEAATPGDERAVDVALRAAAATRDQAPLSAARWYQRALDLLPPDAAERGRLLGRQAAAYWKGARPEAAVDAGNRALAVLEPDETASTLATVINATYASGRLKEALQVCSAAVERFPANPVFLAQRGLVLAHLGQPEEALDQATRARRALGDATAEEQAVAYSYLGHVEHQVGSATRIDEAARELEQIGVRGEGTRVVARRSALESAASILGISGSLSRATQMLDLAEQVLPLTAQLDLGGQTQHTLAQLQSLSGNWDAVLDTVHAGAVNLEFAGLAMNLAWLRLIEVDVLLERGKLADAEAVLDATETRDEWSSYVASCACRRARIALARQDHDAALALFAEQREAGDRHGWREVQAYALNALVRAHLDRDQRSEAEDAARELAQIADLSGIPSLRCKADIAWAEVFADRAPAERTLAFAQAEGLRFLEARAHHVLGTLDSNVPSRPRPAPDEQQEHLLRATELYTELGAQAWQKRVAARGRQLGVSLATAARRRDTGENALTETEKQLVELVRDGLSNPEIAQRLHYSRKTVEAYLSRLYRKTGCTSRIGLVVALGRQGAAGAAGSEG